MAVHQSCEEVAIDFCRNIYEDVKSVFRLTKSGFVFLTARNAQWTPTTAQSWLNGLNINTPHIFLVIIVALS